jgi:hypothetical protein
MQSRYCRGKREIGGGKKCESVSSLSRATKFCCRGHNFSSYKADYSGIIGSINKCTPSYGFKK